MATKSEQATKHKLTLDDLLGKLSRVQPIGDQQWKASCPAHTDWKPSLSVAVDNDRILMHCHAGCSTKKIVKAIGLEMSDLFLDGDNDTPSDCHKRCRYATAREAAASLKLGEPSQRWGYLDVAGNKVGFILRWDRPDGKEIRPVSRNGDGWIVGGMSEPRPLYCLSELGEAERVYVTEGEKAADAVQSLGLNGTTSAHGAKSAGKTNWYPLAGKEVILLPDNDEAGRCYAEDVARLVASLDPPPTVKRVNLKNLPDGGDIYDWIERGRQKGKRKAELRDCLERLADEAEVLESEPNKPAASTDQSDDKQEEPKKKSAATKLIELTSGIELWHTPNLDPMRLSHTKGHQENWPVHSIGFKRWLGYQYYFVGEKVHRVLRLSMTPCW